MAQGIRCRIMMQPVKDMRLLGTYGRRRLFLGSIASLMLMLSFMPVAYAYCTDPLNSQVSYCGWPDCTQQTNAGTFWVQVATANGPCTIDKIGEKVCSYVATTQGGKANLDSAGFPAVYNSSGTHANAYVESLEPPNKCSNNGGAGACWVQVGWLDGWGQRAEPACGAPSSLNTNGAVDVFVEIYDDSGTPCTVYTPEPAPANGAPASYDARYYTTLPNGQYRYEVYYEVPGSNNIQNLGYGDFNSYSMTELVSGEAAYQGTNLTCPTLGHTNLYQWDTAGQTVPNTFAGPLNLYQNGAWHNWTTAIAPSNGSVFPPYNNPYQIQAISNWSAGDYTQFQFGGPSQ